MMIPCNYEINVAKVYERIGWNGKPQYAHYCKIELGDHLPETAEEIFDDICNRFPKKCGFECTLHKVECYSKEVKKK